MLQPRVPRFAACAKWRAPAGPGGIDQEACRQSEQLPRFYVDPPLPQLPGQTLTLSSEEGKHAVRVLRLKQGARLEVCDGRGSVCAAEISSIRGRSDVTLATLEAPVTVPHAGVRWVVAVASGGLKGSRGDWLVEKAVEIGASALLPILCERSQTMGTARRKPSREDATGGRLARWGRVAQAATKQSLRTLDMDLMAAGTVDSLCALISGEQGATALLATAGGGPLSHSLRTVVDRHAAGAPQVCYLVIGPEGDFAPAEKEALIAAGAVPVGLGPTRLRVETAALCLLSAALLTEHSF